MNCTRIGTLLAAGLLLAGIGCKDPGLKGVGDAGVDAGVDAGPNCIIPEYVTSNLVLDSSCPVWTALTPVYVAGTANPVLTIDPGAKVVFPAAPSSATTTAALYIGSFSGLAGGLVANGTASQPIVITSNAGTPAAGQWGGVVFGPQTLAGSASLQYVTIEAAGGPGGNDLQLSVPVPLWAALTVEAVDATTGATALTDSAATAAVAPTLNNVTIRDSATSGIIFAGQKAAFGAGSGTIDVNGFSGIGYPYVIEPNSVGSIPSTITAENGPSGQMAVLVRGPLQYSANVIASETWPSLSMPYHIVGTITVLGSPDPATMTIASPNRLLFEDNYAIDIDPGGSGQGFLVANGTASEPIAFTSVDSSPAPGAWYGFYFQTDSAGQAASSLSYASVSYATADPSKTFKGGGQTKGALEVENLNDTTAAAGPAIDHVSFDHYPDHAIVTESLSSVSTSAYLDAGNTFDNPEMETVSYCYNGLTGCSKIGN